jgi:hypothetical protein
MRAQPWQAHRAEQLFFFIVVAEGTLQHLQKFLQYIKCSILEFTSLHHSPLSSPTPILGVVSTGLILPFTYMCTQYLHGTHPPNSFLTHTPTLVSSRYWQSFVEV